MPTPRELHPSIKAVLLAFSLLLFGLLFTELVSLLIAILITVLIAIPLAALATRLEERGVPRPVGAGLGIFVGVGVVVGLLVLVIPPFVDEMGLFVDEVPAITDSLQEQIGGLVGAKPGEVGESIQNFLQRYTDDPGQLIGPLASIGLSVLGVLAALILMLLTAFYIAIKPEPLISGTLSLFPPERRAWAMGVMERLREAWVGWQQGVLIDMAVTGVLIYLGLMLIGLDFAVVFAVLSALLVVIPYFGAIAGGIPPVLFALTDSPGKAALALAHLPPRPAGREQPDHPARDGAAGQAAPGGGRHRRRDRGPAVRVPRPLRGRPDPLADRDRRRRDLGQADGDRTRRHAGCLGVDGRRRLTRAKRRRSGARQAGERNHHAVRLTPATRRRGVRSLPVQR